MLFDVIFIVLLIILGVLSLRTSKKQEERVQETDRIFREFNLTPQQIDKRHDTLLENINNYDGTEKGQKEIF